MAQSLVTSTLQGTSQAATAATRHLCAGAFLDREFRELLLLQVRHNAARRVSPSYGFDLVPVASQAWRSWWLETTGQALILGPPSRRSTASSTTRTTLPGTTWRSASAARARW